MILSFFYCYGCTKVNFEATPTETCKKFNAEFGVNSCVLTPDGLNSYKYSTRVGEVEIVFVDDNSGSMYVEQQKIASQFPGFLDTLREFDYRIGVITTDISAADNPPAAKNGYGAFQDGKLLKFSNGGNFLSNPKFDPAVHSENINLFQTTIKRDETEFCQEKNTCPSSDEQGIHSLIKALGNSENQPFFRGGGHLAVVILSDEDERSVAPGADSSRINRILNPTLWDSSAYKLRVENKPETFMDKFAEKFGTAKSLSVHSIIIRPKVVRSSGGEVSIQTGDPEGDACLIEQGKQSYTDTKGAQRLVKGFYGTQYARLSVPDADLKARVPSVLDGHLGNICSSSYTQQLGPIADKIKGLDFVSLPCPPNLSTVKVSVTPKPSFQFKSTIDPQDGRKLVFTPQLPPGSVVDLEFKCPR